MMTKNQAIERAFLTAREIVFGDGIYEVICSFAELRDLPADEIEDIYDNIVRRVDDYLDDQEELRLVALELLDTSEIPVLV